MNIDASISSSFIDVAVCCVCRRKISKNLTVKCKDCQAVYYCSDICQQNDRDSHAIWCSKVGIHDMLSSKAELITPFTWSKETGRPDFSENKYQKFLADHGVQNAGLWVRESPQSNQSFPFGLLPKDDDDPFVLPSESCILETFDGVTPCSDELTCWEEYYKWRGFRIDSPICILLQWPLTVYHILIHCLPLDYSKSVDHKMVIHILGAEKEADFGISFLELGVLCPNLQLDLYITGPAISPEADFNSIKRKNVQVTIRCGYYDKITNLPEPQLVIGFNAGLAAYRTWIHTSLLLKKNSIPAYFTDYCWRSFELTRTQVQSLNGFQICDGRINPFKSPIRIQSLDSDLPQYSNNILFYLKYK